MKILFKISLICLLASTAFGIVGDFRSYGSILTLRHLHINSESGQVSAASSGGLVSFNTESGRFSVTTNTSFLDHIRIDKYFINTDGSSWFSYGVEPTVVTVRMKEGVSSHIDLGFTSVNAFAGDSANVFAAYMDGLTPGIAQFKKFGGSYIYTDYFNQFPGAPDKISALAVVNDSLYAASSRGLARAWVQGSNLKPQSAWTGMLEGLDISAMQVFRDTLYLMSGSRIYRYQNADTLEVFRSSSGLLTDFATDSLRCLAVSENSIYDIFSGDLLFTTDYPVTGLIISGETLLVGCEGQGLQFVDLETGNSKFYRPNTMLELTSPSLAMGPGGRLVVAGLEGVSIMDNEVWHNLVFSGQNESIHDSVRLKSFSADTLNIATRIGEETAVYDALITKDDILYATVTDVSVRPVPGQSETAKGPGVLIKINLNDYSSYDVFDTTDNMFHGTEELGGSPYYLKMRGLIEGENDDVWVLNAHTIEAEPLVKVFQDGTFRKYSVSESENTLQILPREMAFGKYGRLWIANQERQSDVPRTAGGMTVYDRIRAKWRLINSSDGLADNDVYSIASDPLSGNIWAATAGGVQMIRTPSDIGAENDISMNPVIDGLSGKIPQKIRIDAAGNKWILTSNQGIQIYMANNRWYRDGAGLTEANSDLLDDVVYDVVFDDNNGYAYILAASGLNRFESRWTIKRSSMDNVIAYPQPFLPGSDPYIVIDGLADQSKVKFVTLTGRVIFTINPGDDQNMGKQVVWDGYLTDGSRLPRGVYLVVISNYDGIRARTKIAVK